MQDYRPIGKLEPSTLVYTVAAVIISLPSVDNDVPLIHKALIEEYPQYSRGEIGVLSQHPTDPLKNREETIVQHALNSPDRSWGVLLMQDRILFHTTDYEGFEHFAERFSAVLRTIQEQTKLKYHNGLAFRHIDNILPLDEKKELSAAIQKPFLSPSLSKSLNTKHSRHEYIYEKDERKLVFRLYNHDQGKAASIPQEIFSNYFALKGKPGIKGEERPFVLADFEANNINETVSEKFEIDAMKEELSFLHKMGSVAYREVITPDELKERGCQNVD